MLSPQGLLGLSQGFAKVPDGGQCNSDLAWLRIKLRKSQGLNPKVLGWGKRYYPPPYDGISLLSGGCNETQVLPGTHGV
jgi:hypothetical protein